MTKGYKRTQRVAELIQVALAEIMQRDVKDLRFGMVTITVVSVSHDLSFAKVFVSVLENEISKKGKPPEPDFIVADRQSGALLGVELTSVYSDDRSVPDVHMKLDNLKTIPYDPGEVERYLQQIINKAKAKADIYTRNHPGNMPLALSIYVNEYIAIHADEEEWLEVGKKVQENLGPFQMAILWSLPDDGMVAVEKESVVYRRLS